MGGGRVKSAWKMSVQYGVSYLRIFWDILELRPGSDPPMRSDRAYIVRTKGISYALN